MAGDKTKTAVREMDDREDDRVIKVLSVVVFLLVPFLGGNHLALPHLTIDRFWIDTTFLLVLTIAIAFAFIKGIRSRYDYRNFLLFFFPFFIVSGLSLIYTWNTYNTARELNVLVWLLGTTYLWTLLRDRDLPLRAFVWGSVAVVLCAILQLKVLFPDLARTFTGGWYASMLGERPIPFVAFVNENMFGGYLLLALPIAIFLGIYQRQRRYTLTIPLLVVGVLLSLSRLSMIVLTLELLATCVIFLVRRRKRDIVKTFAGVALALCIFLALVYVQVSPSEKRVEQSVKGKTATALTQVKNLNLRTSIWRAAHNAFKERPLFGYGGGAFEYAYRKHFAGGTYTRYSHGAVPKIAVELGLVGLLASLWYVLGILWQSRGGGLPNPFILTAVAGGFLFALVDCALDTAAFVVTFLSLSSLFLVTDSVRPVTGKIFSVPLMVLLVLSFAFTARADLAKKTVEEGGLFEEIGNAVEAANSYRQACELMPIDNEPRIRYIKLLGAREATSFNSESKQNLTEALGDKWNQTGLERDKDSELVFVNAIANKALGKNTVAYDEIREALRLYPSSPYYASLAADWLISAEKYEAAEGIITLVEQFTDNIRNSKSPYGLYIYRLRELRADIEFKKGNNGKAVILGQQNLDSAKRGEFVITSYKARDFVKKEWLITHLADKLASYKSSTTPEKQE